MTHQICCNWLATNLCENILSRKILAIRDRNDGTGIRQSLVQRIRLLGNLLPGPDEVAWQSIMQNRMSSLGQSYEQDNSVFAFITD